MKPDKPWIIAKTIVEKTTSYVEIKVAITIVIINNHMVVIQV
jgi:hypothetical protein